MRGTFGKEKVILVCKLSVLALHCCISFDVYLYQPNGVKDHSYSQARAEAGLTLELNATNLRDYNIFFHKVFLSCEF